MTDVSNLRVGDTYNSRIGPVVYRGLDYYWGETTYKFEVPGSPRAHYERPEGLLKFLASSVTSNEAALYAECLATKLWEKHYRNTAPDWKPLAGDLIGLLTQIDNMTSTLHRVSEDFVMVPRKATQAMIDAATSTTSGYGGPDHDYDDDVEDHWDAMVTVALTTKK